MKKGFILDPQTMIAIVSFGALLFLVFTSRNIIGTLIPTQTEGLKDFKDFTTKVREACSRGYSTLPKYESPKDDNKEYQFYITQKILLTEFTTDWMDLTFPTRTIAGETVREDSNLDPTYTILSVNERGYENRKEDGNNKTVYGFTGNRYPEGGGVISGWWGFKDLELDKCVNQVCLCYTKEYRFVGTESIDDSSTEKELDDIFKLGNYIQKITTTQKIFRAPSYFLKPEGKIGGVCEENSDSESCKDFIKHLLDSLTRNSFETNNLFYKMPEEIECITLEELGCGNQDGSSQPFIYVLKERDKPKQVMHSMSLKSSQIFFEKDSKGNIVIELTNAE